MGRYLDSFVWLMRRWNWRKSGWNRWHSAALLGIAVLYGCIFLTAPDANYLYRNDDPRQKANFSEVRRASDCIVRFDLIDHPQGCGLAYGTWYRGEQFLEWITNGRFEIGYRYADSNGDENY